ncbi:MAG: molybdopterin converting factor subunit 1 [Anaerolineales bacterium]
MNHIKVLFFATLRDKAGTKMIEIDVEPGATIRAVKDAVIRRFPGIQESIEHCLAAVNHEYSDEAAEIPPAAEIAFFPPVSGGGH